MKLTYSSLLIIAIFLMSICHTKGETFHNEAYKPRTVRNSLYKNIEFLDSRPNNEPKKVKIEDKTFREDLQSFINQTVDNSALNGTLFVNLRKLNLHFDKKKNCYIARIRVSLFDHINNNYYNLGSLDDTMEIPKNQNPNTLISNIIYRYVSDNLIQKINDSTPYVIEDMYSFDIMEKLKMPLFSNGVLTDGIYLTYEDFRDQYPLDDLLSADVTNGEISNVRATNQQLNRSTAVDPQQIYAIVYNGQAYIAIDNRFVPLRLDNDDFLFTKKIDKNKQRMNVVYRIDHLKGNPLQTRIN